jgi:hypothetical protein
MEGGGDLCSDKEKRRVSQTLSAAERDRILAAVKAADFWRSPPLIRPTWGFRDATTWVFEGVRGGQYRRSAYRWSSGRAAESESH